MKKISPKIIVAISIVAIFLFIWKLQTNSSLPVYDSVSLSYFGGSDATKPVLLAYQGYVYDVSPGRYKFYNPGQPYHDLAGKDSTSQLELVGGSIIKSKYKIVGIYKK
ncbi:MAG: hypothetical protein HYV90_04050 [Candidatus Woesebacteria bacterium]|nr:MAG: hypothetical protein HYV90_04050 [Candidatus Woesebacteria bacterium]